MAKKKNDDWDNGMTVAPMNGDELPAYRRLALTNREKRTSKGKIKSDVTKKEQRAMMRALFAVLLPRFCIVLGCFALTALLMWLWLK